MKEKNIGDYGIYTFLNPFEDSIEDEIYLNIGDIIVCLPEDDFVSFSYNFVDGDSKFSNFKEKNDILPIVRDIKANVELVDMMDAFIYRECLVYLQKDGNDYVIVYVTDYDGKLVYAPVDRRDLLVSNGLYTFLKESLIFLEAVTYKLDDNRLPYKIKFDVEEAYALYYLMRASKTLDDGDIIIEDVLSKKEIEFFELMEYAIEYIFRDLLQIYEDNKPQLLILRGYEFLHKYWGTPLNFILEQMEFKLLEDNNLLENALFSTPFWKKITDMRKEL